MEHVERVNHEVKDASHLCLCLGQSKLKDNEKENEPCKTLDVGLGPQKLPVTEVTPLRHRALH